MNSQTDYFVNQFYEGFVMLLSEDEVLFYLKKYQTKSEEISQTLSNYKKSHPEYLFESDFTILSADAGRIHLVKKTLFTMQENYRRMKLCTDSKKDVYRRNYLQKSLMSHSRTLMGYLSTFEVSDIFIAHA